MTEVMGGALDGDCVRLVVDQAACEQYRRMDLGAVGMARSIEWRDRVEVDRPLVIVSLTQ